MPNPAMMVDFHRALARGLRAGDEPPSTRREWDQRRRRILARMTEAAGELPEEPCPLAPGVWGVVERPGFKIERLTFTSRPGVAVTANAYVPVGPKRPLPAVLCVHGHWPQARV